MIRAMIGNNLKRDAYNVKPSDTLRSALDLAGIDYGVGLMHLDGASLSPGDLDKTFADFGITEKCFLLNVAKAENA